MIYCTPGLGSLRRPCKDLFGQFHLHTPQFFSVRKHHWQHGLLLHFILILQWHNMMNLIGPQGLLCILNRLDVEQNMYIVYYFWLKPHWVWFWISGKKKRRKKKKHTANIVYIYMYRYYIFSIVSLPQTTGVVVYKQYFTANLKWQADNPSFISSWQLSPLDLTSIFNGGVMSELWNYMQINILAGGGNTVKPHHSFITVTSSN